MTAMQNKTSLDYFKPIYHPYIIKIKTIFQTIFQLKIQTPQLNSKKSSLCCIVDFLIFGTDFGGGGTYGLFPQFSGILNFECFPNIVASRLPKTPTLVPIVTVQAFFPYLDPSLPTIVSVER